MGVYATKLPNGKILASKEPVKINNTVFDPKIHKQDIQGFKWFKNKTEALKFYNVYNNIDKELFLAELSNGNKVYVIGIDELDCRDKIYEYIQKRFFSTVLQILKMEHLAETNTKGFVNKLITE